MRACQQIKEHAGFGKIVTSHTHEIPFHLTIIIDNWNFLLRYYTSELSSLL